MARTVRKLHSLNRRGVLNITHLGYSLNWLFRRMHSGLRGEGKISHKFNCSVAGATYHQRRLLRGLKCSGEILAASEMAC